MDTQHADVIERAVAYVREVLGLAPEDESEPVPTAAPEHRTDEPTGNYPREDTLKSALQLDAESVRRRTASRADVETHAPAVERSTAGRIAPPHALGKDTADNAPPQSKSG